MRLLLVMITFLALGAFMWIWLPSVPGPAKPGQAMAGTETSSRKIETAYLAGGCFWCVESDFEKVPGVVKIISGYAGGQGENPTYEDYAGKGYVEAVEVRYDPAQVSYQALLDFFWRHVDPTDPGGQFVDRGRQYRSAIFYRNDEQKRLAAESKQNLEKSGRFQKPIVTEILPFTNFYPAEEYHQGYHRKHPTKYAYYRWNSGRDQFLEKVWGKQAPGDKP